ncbi:MAG: hypothetical protein JNL74_24210 [Fibrobacteres bacterium]|nr:hypothetical protein [Fibrobacterota bacterium]
MTLLAEKIVEDFNDLALEERIAVTNKLLATLHGHTTQNEVDWNSEIDNRISQIDKGQVKLLDGNKVISEMRSRIQK